MDIGFGGKHLQEKEKEIKGDEINIITQFTDIMMSGLKEEFAKIHKILEEHEAIIKILVNDIDDIKSQCDKTSGITPNSKDIIETLTPPSQALFS